MEINGFIDSSGPNEVGGWYAPILNEATSIVFLVVGDTVTAHVGISGRASIPHSNGFHFSGMGPVEQLKLLTGEAVIIVSVADAIDCEKLLAAKAMGDKDQAALISELYKKYAPSAYTLKLFSGFTKKVLERNLSLVSPVPPILGQRKLDYLWKQTYNTSLKRQTFDITIERNNYFLDLHLTAGDTLFISFESGGFDKVGAETREAWGASYFRSRGISYIGVKPSWNNWYITPPMEAIFSELKNYISSYDQVITYGSSMGGFAALSYANLIKAQKVIAFCPQSTRNPLLAPWEMQTKREISEMKFDSQYADCVGNFSACEAAYVFTDLHNHRDRLHAARLNGNNLHVINTPFIGHAVPLFLHPIGMLLPIPTEIMDGTFSRASFHQNFRKRRQLKRYFNVLREKTKGRPRFAAIVERFSALSPSIGLD